MKHKKLPTCTLITFIILNTICLVTYGQKAKPNFNGAIANSAKILDSTLQQLHTPAISIAVGLNDQIIWAKAIGYKDLEKSELADVNTKFRVGSSSKAITSVALGQLIQRKKLILDSTIQHYIPFFDPTKPPITIRQLASHSSGIRNYLNNEFNSNIAYSSIEQSMKVFMYDSLLFKPGNKFSYATYNYTVLSAAIEQITKTSFLDYMQKNIFNSVGMNNTVPDHKFKPLPNTAEFYNYVANDNKYKKPNEVDNSNKWAGGGFLSTPTDLVKLGNSLLYNRILNKETLAIIWEPQKLNDGKVNGTKYAIGWRNDSVKLFNGSLPVQQIHHGGSASGATSLLILFPEYKMSISILANRDFASADLFKYAHKVAEQFIAEIDEKKTK